MIQIEFCGFEIWGFENESGYRGDVELGYGDEYDDEEEEDVKLLFWGGKSSKLYNTSV